MTKRARRPAAKIGSPDRSTDQEYWLALGEFIEAFNRAENQLFLFLIHYIGVEKVVGKALLRRDRVATLLGHLRSVFEVRPLNEDLGGELDDVLVRLNRINDERNLIVHSISYSYADIGRVRTKRLRAATDDQFEEAQASPTHLNNLSRDLGRITKHLFSAWMHHTEPLAKRERAYPELRQPWLFNWPGMTSGKSSNTPD